MNFGSAAYACVRPLRRTFQGPRNLSILLEAYKVWNANAIRLPLNEHCWLGINGEDSAYFGSGYRNDVIALTNLFTDAGMVVIIDLHWASPSKTAPPNGHTPMPNTEHSALYWASVAKEFRDNDKVIFELYNEPYPDNGAFNSTEGWRCLRTGGNCTGVDYEAASMQSLVDAVRNFDKGNASNVILLPGLRFTNSLAQWLENKPRDPCKNMGAAWHSYCKGYCNN